MTSPISNGMVRWFQNIIALIVYFAIGFFAFGFLISSDPFVYDDHGFHFATLYFTLTESIPHDHRLIDWNPYWFAGIPELQFYPPGYVFLGIILYYFSFQSLSIGMVYQILILFAFFIPAVTGYFLLRYTGFSWWISFISGLFLLTYSGGASGTFYGVIVGLINSRLALGLFPLVILVYLRQFFKPFNPGVTLLLILLIALIFITHPYHIFLPVLGLFAQLYTWNRTGLIESKTSTRYLLLVLMAGIFLVAFWWIPWWAHSDYMSHMQVWTGNEKLRGLIRSLSGGKTEKVLLVFYCLSALSLIYGKHSEKQKAIIAGFLLTPVLVLTFLFLIRLVFIGLFKNYSIDPWRLQDDFYFSVIITSGIGLGYLVDQIVKCSHNFQRAWKFKYGFFAFLVLFIFMVYSGIQMIQQSFHFKGYGQFGFLRQARIQLRLDELWDYLKHDTEGRILFTSSQTGYPGRPAQINTHVLALTPIYTNRSILGAVNEPFYSTASYLYFGKKSPIVIRREADALDDQSLFGIDWKNMDPDLLWKNCRRFNVTTLVVTDEEINVLDLLRNSTNFREIKSIGKFHIFHTLNYSSEWISSANHSVQARLMTFGKDEIMIQIISSRQNALLLVKSGFYPRWKAYRGTQPLSLKSDDTGLMMLILPEGENYVVSIRYQSTLAEKLGWFVTLFILLIVFGFGIKSIFNRNR